MILRKIFIQNTIYTMFQDLQYIAERYPKLQIIFEKIGNNVFNVRILKNSIMKISNIYNEMKDQKVS